MATVMRDGELEFKFPGIHIRFRGPVCGESLLAPVDGPIQTIPIYADWDAYARAVRMEEGRIVAALIGAYPGIWVDTPDGTDHEVISAEYHPVQVPDLCPCCGSPLDGRLEMSLLEDGE